MGCALQVNSWGSPPNWPEYTPPTQAGNNLLHAVIPAGLWDVSLLAGADVGHANCKLFHPIIYRCSPA